MGAVTTKASPTADPLATLSLERHHAELMLATLVMRYTTKADEIGSRDPDLTPDDVPAILDARAALDEMEGVLEQTGLWRERATKWPCRLTANREWLIEQVCDRLQSDADMIVHSSDRSLVTVRRYSDAVVAGFELLEQLDVQELTR